LPRALSFKNQNQMSQIFKIQTKAMFLMLALALIFGQFFCQKSVAEKVSLSLEMSNSEVAKEIEKNLLFDKNSRQQIDVYHSPKKSKKSDYTIGKADEKTPNRQIEITLTDTSLPNFELRQKEKLAYNAALIGHYEVAIELYKQVLALEPQNKYSKFSLAVVYQKLGQIAQAKVLYRELLKDEPKNSEEIIGNLLAILIEESPRDSVYLLSSLTAQNPQSAYILAQAAIVHEKIKNYQQAASLLERAIDLDNKNLTYKYNLAVIYDKLLDSQKALELYLEVENNYSGDIGLVAIDQIQQRIATIQNKI